MKGKLMTEEGLIKISVNGERFWVEDLGEGRYKVRNCLVLNDFGLNDIIDLDGNVLQRFGRNALLKYKVNEGEEVEAIFAKVAKYLESDNKMLVEGLTLGILAVTIPYGIDDEEVSKIIDNCPIECVLEFSEEE